MKYNNIALTLLLVVFLSFSTTPTSATKIQKNDSWQYEDQLSKTYNETTLDIVQLEGENNPVAVGILNTTRPFIFDLDLIILDNPYTGNLSIDLTMSYDYMYVTQEGSIPFTAKNTKVNGTIYEDLWNYTINVDNYNASWSYTGDPSESFTTTSSSEYSLQIEYIQQFPAYVKYNVRQTFIVSSDSNIEDKIKNFTITPTEKYYFYERATNGSGGVIEHVEYTDYGDGGLNLNSFPVAMTLTYEEGISQPTYIAQTEPAKISSLSLSSLSSLMEYTLVRDNENNVSFPVITLIAIPIALIIRRKTDFDSNIFKVSIQ